MENLIQDINKPIYTMDEVIRLISEVLNQYRENPLDEIQPIRTIMQNWVPNKEEWSKYALVNSKYRYTRNLVATDNERYTLLILCWNPLNESPIHDHPCDGCWVRVLEGTIAETQYKLTESGPFEQSAFAEVSEGDITYINNSMGYHKIGNPKETGAVTFHLYSPPFDSCRVFTDVNDATVVNKPTCKYYSERGEIVVTEENGICTK